jgi:hypothetical protein
VAIVRGMTSSLPAHPSAVDPARDRVRAVRHTRTLVGLGIGALVLVVLLPVAGFLLWLYAGPDIEEPRAVAEQFLRHVEAGDDPAAYGLLCAAIRQRTTAEAFTAAVERPARPASHTLGRATFVDEAGGAASVEARLADRAGGVRTISIRLEDTAAGWRVCGDPFG